MLGTQGTFEPVLAAALVLPFPLLPLTIEEKGRRGDKHPTSSAWPFWLIQTSNSTFSPPAVAVDLDAFIQRNFSLEFGILNFFHIQSETLETL